MSRHSVWPRGFFCGPTFFFSFFFSYWGTGQFSIDHRRLQCQTHCIQTTDAGSYSPPNCGCCYFTRETFSLTGTQCFTPFLFVTLTFCLIFFSFLDGAGWLATTIVACFYNNTPYYCLFYSSSTLLVSFPFCGMFWGFSWFLTIS